MDYNSIGFIFFLAALSIAYVQITGVLENALRPDATPEARKKCVMSIVTLPILGVVITLSAPHYAYGLAGAGLLLGFVLTLNRVTHGISALSTEPTAIFILYLVSMRSRISGNKVSEIEALIARFGYQLTADHVGYLSCGIAGGIVLGIVPRMVLKARALRKAARPRMTARQIEIHNRKKAEEKAVLKSYSYKARRLRGLVARLRALKSSWGM